MKEHYKINKIEELSKTIFAKAAGQVKFIGHFNHGRYFIEFVGIETENDIDKEVIKE